METYNADYLRKDNQLLVITHLTQLVTYLTGFGGLIVPLILWAVNKNKVQDMDEQGRMIINFQISILIYAIVSIPLIFLFGLGIITLIAVGIITLVFPILNAVKVSRDEKPHYPFTIKFL